MTARVLLPLVLSLGLLGPAVRAQDTDPEAIVSGLSQNRVSITANYDGSEILVYGAVKRETPIPEGKLEVIVTVEGGAAPRRVGGHRRGGGGGINQGPV